MNIFSLIIDNLRRGRVSFRLPHQHECTSGQYRGLIHNDAERCIGCGMCAYICPSDAIEVKRSGDTYSWSYDPGKCAFCGNCIERCKPNTLTIESKLPPLYAEEGGLVQVLNMVRKRPVRPAASAEKAPITANAAPSAEKASTVAQTAATTP